MRSTKAACSKKGKRRMKENIMQEQPHDADCSTGPAENFCGNVAFFRPKNAPLLAELNPSFALVSSQIIAFAKQSRLRKKLCMCKCMFFKRLLDFFLNPKTTGGRVIDRNHLVATCFGVTRWIVYVFTKFCRESALCPGWREKGSDIHDLQQS